MWVKFLLEVYEENGRKSCEGRKEIKEKIILFLLPFSSYILLLILTLPEDLTFNVPLFWT